MKYISSNLCILRIYALASLMIYSPFLAHSAPADPGQKQGARLALSGIDGTANYAETVCPGFNLCFDIFSFGGNQTQKAKMYWDHAIPSASFMVTNEDMPSGHFCWTPTIEEARATPYIFRVTMESDDGEERVFSYSITVPLLRVTIETSDVTCYGNSDGSASAMVTGGSGNYLYQWGNSNETAASVHGLREGNYTVQVMDDYGCEAAAAARILSPQPLVLDAVAQHVSCPGNGGQAEIFASGGTMPYTYSWLPSDGYTEKLDNLPSGVYTAVVRDANGCTAYKQVNISAILPSADPDARSGMIASESNMDHVLIYPNPAREQFTVKNISEATVTVSVLNCLGQDVYRTIHIPANLSVSIPMDGQSTGIYLVKVQQYASMEMIRLIKE